MWELSYQLFSSKKRRKKKGCVKSWLYASFLVVLSIKRAIFSEKFYVLTWHGIHTCTQKLYTFVVHLTIFSLFGWFGGKVRWFFGLTSTSTWTTRSLLSACEEYTALHFMIGSCTIFLASLSIYFTPSQQRRKNERIGSSFFSLKTSKT